MLEIILIVLVPLFLFIFPNGLATNEEVEIEEQIKRERRQRRYRRQKNGDWWTDGQKPM